MKTNMPGSPASGGNSQNARLWLRRNGYEDIAATIDDIMLRWSQAGKGTRRNWWDVLAGSKKGGPRTIGSVTFPILRAAQIRQRRATRDGVWHADEEPTGEIKSTNRWPD